MCEDRPTPRVVVVGAGAAGSLTRPAPRPGPRAAAARRSTSCCSTPPPTGPGHRVRHRSTRGTCSTCRPGHERPARGARPLRRLAGPPASRAAARARCLRAPRLEWAPLPRRDPRAAPSAATCRSACATSACGPPGCAARAGRCAVTADDAQVHRADAVVLATGRARRRASAGRRRRCATPRSSSPTRGPPARSTSYAVTRPGRPTSCWSAPA